MSGARSSKCLPDRSEYCMTVTARTLSTQLKSHSRQWLFCFCLVFLLTGCAGEIVPAQLTGATMGTTWHVSYMAPPKGPSADQLQKGIEEQLERVNSSMSTYRSDSEISRFNAGAPLAWFRSSEDFFQVLTAALEVGGKSEGAYDVTVAPLVNLWGFGPDGIIDKPPREALIEEARARVGQHQLSLDSAEHSVLKRSELTLDFSSLAKGYAVDKVAQWLLDQGITRYMVEVGGELQLSGLSGRGDPWRIAIEQPERSARSMAVTLHLTDVAVATSGDYRNYFESNGQHYSHIIDPRTGYPIVHDLVSVTVVHPSCMIADAWATALTVLGAERAMAVAQTEGLAVYFIRRVDDTLVHSHTRLFAAYLNN